MRKLSFKGYLRGYCCEMAGENTQSLKRLCRLAATTRPRVAEPLFLLAALEGKTATLLVAAADSHLAREYACLAVTFPAPDVLMAALEQGDTKLPVRYRKVYGSYLVRSDRLATDRHVSLLMREQALKAMCEKGISNYRVYTDLGLNPGNVNAFFKHGDASKVSRATARSLLDYALGHS